jgi:hypothetical protein
LSHFPWRFTVQTKTITVTFSPPLALYLDIPRVDNNSGIDYSKTPVSITGRVSKPQAEVTVNGQEVEVQADGSFSAESLLDQVQASATLGEEHDSDFLPYFVSNGKAGIVPGAGVVKSSMIRVAGNPIDLSQGQSAVLDFDFNVRKDLAQDSKASFVISRVSPGSQSLGSEGVQADFLPPVPGLLVMMEPSDYTTYPNIDYHSSITITTGGGVAPGQYIYFLVGYLNARAWTAANIVVNVSP